MVKELSFFFFSFPAVELLMTSWLLLSLWFLKTLEVSGLSVTLEDVADTDHFSIIEKLVDGEYRLTKVQHTHKNATKRGPLEFSCLFFFNHHVFSHSGHMVFAVHHERMMFQIIFPFVASLEDDGKELRSWSLIRYPMRTYLCINIHLWTESLCTDSRQLCMMVNVEFLSIWTDLQLAGLFCSYNLFYCVITYICSL